jgi:hypothetical protein
MGTGNGTVVTVNVHPLVAATVARMLESLDCRLFGQRIILIVDSYLLELSHDLLLPMDLALTPAK